MLIITIGYGKNLNREILKNIAGSNGHVLLFKDVAELIKNIDAIVADACGKNKIESYYRPVLCSYQFVTSTCPPSRPRQPSGHLNFSIVPQFQNAVQMPHPRAIFLGV